MRIIVCIILVHLLSFTYCQVDKSDFLESRTISNRIDSLFYSINMDGAINYYSENTAKVEHLYSADKHLGLSHIAKSLGKNQIAKDELIRAVKKGIIWKSIFDDDFLSLYNYINSFEDKPFSDSILILFNDISPKKLNSSIPLQLKKIEENDQKLRNDNRYIDCVAKYYDYIFSDNRDTFNIDSNTIECALEFREEDSTIIQLFVDIIDSLGFVPDDNIGFGFADINIIVIHTSYYNFTTNLDSLYLKSVFLGTLSPKTYAWYKGYNNSFKHLEPTYYYIYNEDAFNALNFTRDKINLINGKRREIGLPLLPHNIWQRFYSSD